MSDWWASRNVVSVINSRFCLRTQAANFFGPSLRRICLVPSGVSFPLTPAPSLREREKLSSALEESCASELFPAPDPLLPLLGGEGWGEGEESATPRSGSGIR